ncbi:MAG: polysaccharide biosynthesis/export family protein [Pleomorphochaeta sp.]
MRLKHKKIIILSLILSLFFNANIYSVADLQDVSGFVINSPLYSNIETEDDFDLSLQSFSEQLGLVDTNEIEYDSNLFLLRAISDSNYPITPGDTFRIEYLDGDSTEQRILQVDSNYELTIPLVGSIDATGMTLSQLVSKIKDDISTYYAFSSPQVALVSLGIFSVDVIGDVISSTTFAVNGLTRLSDVVKIAAFNANTRDIEIRNKAGETFHYDLYLALKKGAVDQNPLLKVGDTVILKEADKTINIVGNVYKPGTYQIKDNEILNNIINYYCGGLLTKADKNNIYLSRFDELSNNYSEDNIKLNSTQKIKNLDTIIIPSIKIEKSSVSVEGAIKDTNVNNATTTSLLTMPQGKIIYNFYPGETLEQMLETISSRFMVNSDLTHAYLIRNDEKINIDILSYLTKNINDNVKLMAGDRIIIPIDNKFVNVQGAVERAGAFAYEPNKKLEYYISLAGGYSQDATQTISITDSQGNKIATDAIIPSDATINVKKDTYRTDVATVASIIAIVASVVSIIDTSVGIFSGN